MWKLEVYRVITNIGGWIVAGESEYIEDLLDLICTTYGLEYRICSPKGEYFTIEWVDDIIDPDYTKPVFGVECSNWPQKIGDIR